MSFIVVSGWCRSGVLWSRTHSSTLDTLSFSRAVAGAFSARRGEARRAQLGMDLHLPLSIYQLGLPFLSFPGRESVIFPSRSPACGESRVPRNCLSVSWLVWLGLSSSFHSDRSFALQFLYIISDWIITSPLSNPREATCLSAT